MEEHAEIASLQKFKILVVDDEENILRAIRRLLIGEDYDVFLAHSGHEGLQMLEDNPDVALIISDQRMPGLSGAEFLEKTKQIAPDAVRMVLTGYADLNAAIAAINKGGAYRYLTKPWNDKELLYAIREGIRQFKLVKENKELHEIIKAKNKELKQWNTQLEYFVQQQTIEIQNKNKELEALNKRLRANFKNTIFAFSGLLEMRDRGSEPHSRNVAELSVMIARAIGLNTKDIEDIMVASLLHDIGKIAIPDFLLEKWPEEMTEEELDLYKQHPVRGQTA
ncbi:MAG: response regulator, partial [Nitrospirae bacterium]|nr:response regulator [Nitrospirota bacterium]